MGWPWASGKGILLIKRAALIAVWLCACAAFIYGFRPDYTLAQAGDILRGEGYRGVRSAGFAVRDWESENPFVAYMPVFEAAPADGRAEYLAVSLETGGISRAAPPRRGKIKKAGLAKRSPKVTPKI